jgi:magnesium chelatase subunit I
MPRYTMEVPILKRYRDLVVHEGNQSLVDALEMSVLSLIAGRPIHVHVEGLRGTGKTTVVRAMKSILPSIERIAGCAYNCEPTNPHCPIHRNMESGDLSVLGTEYVSIPFLEISHAAKLGTVVGSIDLARVVDPNQPEVALLPGAIPRAYRGIIFVDEINRLADTSPELTDVLLDVMGTKPGRLQVEETGLPTFTLPVMCCVWAASNPDEEPGALEDIRRQLSDRFDFVVNMGRPQNHDAVKRILSGYTKEEESIWLQHGGSVPQKADVLQRISLPDDLSSLLAELYVGFGIESLRAVEAISLGARARAAMNLRTKVLLDDIRGVLAITLRHRVDGATLMNISKFLDEYESRRGRNRDQDRTPDGSGDNVHDGQTCEQDSRDLAGSGDTPMKPESLWDRLMKGMGLIRPDLSRRHPGMQGTGFSPGTGASRGQAGHGRRYAAGGGTSIADPRDVDVCAPPGKAKSLFHLAGGDILFTEEDLRIR